MEDFKPTAENLLFKELDVTKEDDLLILCDEELAGLGDFVFDVALSESLHAQALVFDPEEMEDDNFPDEICDAMADCSKALIITACDISENKKIKELKDRCTCIFINDIV